MHDNPFFRFAKSMRTVRACPGMPVIDPVEGRVLEALAASWADGGVVTVMQALRIEPGLSASTVHRRLAGLRAKGLIAFDVSAADSRTKHIVPTTLALAHFERTVHSLRSALRRD